MAGSMPPTAKHSLTAHQRTHHLTNRGSGKCSSSDEVTVGWLAPRGPRLHVAVSRCRGVVKLCFGPRCRLSVLSFTIPRLWRRRLCVSESYVGDLAAVRQTGFKPKGKR